MTDYGGLVRLASFDPGDPHVGTAIWERRGDGPWVCVAAREVEPDRFARSLTRLLDDGAIQRVAYEIFRLGGGQEALMQKGSTMKTTEVIGAARVQCEWHGIEMEGVERGVRKSALTRMRAVGWRFPPGASNHVRDAIAVGAAATGWRAANHTPGDGVQTQS